MPVTTSGGVSGREFWRRRYSGAHRIMAIPGPTITMRLRPITMHRPPITMGLQPITTRHGSIITAADITATAGIIRTGLIITGAGVTTMEDATTATGGSNAGLLRTGGLHENRHIVYNSS